MASLSKAVRTTWGNTQKGVAFIERNAFVFNMTSFAVMIVLAVVYIAQVNASVAKGYVLRDIENNIQDLTLQNQQLQGDTRSLQSLDHVSGAVKLLGMVAAEQPVYIKSIELP